MTTTLQAEMPVGGSARGLRDTHIVLPLFVGATAAVLAVYLALGGRPATADGIHILAVASAGALVAILTWVGMAHVWSRVGREPRETTYRTTAFPFLALLVPTACLPEFVFGAPGWPRVAVVVGMAVALFVLLALLAPLRCLTGAVAWLERRATLLVGVVVALHAVASIGLLVVRYQHFGSFLGEDTAYYNQVFWSTLHGDFFRGSLTQARYFDPPVASEFAIHNSPVMFLLLPFYWLHPSFYTLLVLRNLALSASAIPLFLLARDRLGGLAAGLVVTAYLVSTNLFYQAINGFYPLQFAVLFLPLTLLFFLRQRMRPFLVSLVLALSVREEIALTTALLGVYALLLRRRWPWVVTPVVLSALWWYVSTEWVMVRSRIAMEDLDGFYQLVGGSHNEALAAVIADPGRFLRLVFNAENAAYLYEMLKPTALVSLLSPVSLFAAPTLAVNGIIGAFMTTMRNVSYHYSIVAGVCLFLGLVDGLDRLARRSRIFGVDDAVVRPALAVLLLPLALLGVVDAVRHGGGAQHPLVRDFLPKPYQTTAERVIALVEPEASVAAPNILLPHLSYRSQLYTSGRLWRYNDPPLDYVILDTDVSKLSEADRNRAKYEASIATIRARGGHELILAADGFEVYRARSLQHRRNEARP